TVTATWETNSYTITYMDGYKDGAQGIIDKKTYEYDTDINAITNPYRIGYTFTGWTPNVPKTMPAKDLTVTAKWSVDPTITKTISYTVNYWMEGENTPREKAIVTKNVWINDPDTMVITKVEPRTYNGFKFDHYSVAFPTNIKNGDIINVYYVAEKAPEPVVPINPPTPTDPGTPTTPTTPTTPGTPTDNGTLIPPTTPRATNVATVGNQTVTTLDNTAVVAPAAKANDTVTIKDKATPLALKAQWALLNLILAVACAVTMLLLLVGYVFGKKRKDDDEELETNEDYEETEPTLKRKGLWRVLSIIPGLGSVIIFLLTENMRNPMVFVDKWTLLMIVIALVQLVIVLMSKKKHDTEDNDNEEVMAN
ncbi:MAG: InlB B-repeat-containing protein, partial [Clostridiales bacterium]